MFEPNSIRSLLNKRQTARINSSKIQQQPILRKQDPDYQTMLETKLMIKQIDHQVYTIRQWRQHQRILTQQKLKNNQVIAKISTDQYIKYLDRQSQKDKDQNLKIIKKMKQYQYQGQPQKYQQSPLDHNQILQILTQTDQKIQSSKEKVINPGLYDQHEAFFNSISSLPQIFKHNRQEPNKNNKKIDRKALREQLNQIDNQLKEMEQFLKDQ